MFSRPNLLSIGLAALLGAGTLACGHKASPFPPPLENPATTTDLVLQQRGQAALLTFTYPHLTVAGRLLESLERVEIYRTQRDVSSLFEAEVADETAGETETTEGFPEAPVEQAEPTPPVETQPAAPELPLETLAAPEPAEFLATAQLVESFNAAAIEEATEGDKLTFRVELGDREEQTSHTFAVKTYASERLVSAFSNQATLVQRVPPPPPTDFQLTAEAGGIRLAWITTDDEADQPAAIRVYRRPAQSRLYGPPLARLGGESTEYLDRSAAFGERYIYAVTALGNENPVVESFFGGEREIDYADRFAPSPPTELIALAESGRVRLLWDPSPEDDVVGYIVFRRQAGADFRRLTDESIAAVEYSDRTVESGTTYDYRVAAIDRIGNQSEPGNSVIARVP